MDAAVLNAMPEQDIADALQAQQYADDMAALAGLNLNDEVCHFLAARIVCSPFAAKARASCDLPLVCCVQDNGAGTSKALSGYQLYIQHNKDAYAAIPAEIKGKGSFLKYMSGKWKEEPEEVKARYNEMAKNGETAPPLSPVAADTPNADATPPPPSPQLQLELQEDAGKVLEQIVPKIFDTPAIMINVKHSIVNGELVVKYSLKDKDEIIKALIAQKGEQVTLLVSCFVLH